MRKSSDHECTTGRPGHVLEGVTFEQFAVARLPSLLRYAVVLTGAQLPTWSRVAATGTADFSAAACTASLSTPSATDPPRRTT